MHTPNKFDHDAHARSKSDTDFWGQIRRTVNGQPVGDDQIEMIVHRIERQLELVPGDTLLDLACGNGALASRFFDSLAGYLGVDFSPRLINVAQKFFAQPPRVAFCINGAAEHVQEEAQPERYTKVLCYGSFSYFSAEDARRVLHRLATRFPKVSHVFIGNLPDRDRATCFYTPDRINPAELDDHESPIGIWRSAEAFIELASVLGWKARVSNMPQGYYAAHYRYDILLTR